jgi:gamma-glutamyltranspeptidase/glutathione hydrolase
LSDFTGYRASIAPALRVPYHDHELITVGRASGGTTLAQTMGILDGIDVAALGHNTPAALHVLAQAFRMAFADRFAYLADPEHVAVPLDALLAADYLAERRAAIRPDRVGPTVAGDRSRLGVTHHLAASMPDYTSGGSTTHLSVIDRDGVVVSLTQTLLSLWGSRVVVPGTGILLNNGMMWFDPQPGRPNSVAGGKRPLSNMAPAVVTRDGRTVAALGASGGRRIINCVAQLAMNLIDHGMTMQAAVNAPRIDASTPDLSVSSRLPDATRQALAALGHPLVLKDERWFLTEFASPACIQYADGTFRGGVDPYYFPATAAGV